MSKKHLGLQTREKRKRSVHENDESGYYKDDEPQPGPSTAVSLIPPPNTLRKIAFRNATFPVDKDGYVNAYTDGSRTSRASYAVWFGPSDPMNYYDLLPWYGTQDINVAEAMGICKAIEIVMRSGVEKVKIFSDSQTAINVIESLQMNRKRGMNAKVYKMCPEVFNNILRYRNTVDVILIKVRSKSQGNAGADKLCDEALKIIGCEKKKRKIIKKKIYRRCN